MLGSNERLQVVGDNRRFSQLSNELSASQTSIGSTGSDIQQHLQSMFYLLRPEETLKMVRKIAHNHRNSSTSSFWSAVSFSIVSFLSCWAFDSRPDLTRFSSCVRWLISLYIVNCVRENISKSSDGGDMLWEEKILISFLSFFLFFFSLHRIFLTHKLYSDFIVNSQTCS